MPSIAPVLMLWSVLVPSRQWVAQSQPLEITAKTTTEITLLLADFTGSTIAPTGPVDLPNDQTLDLRTVYPTLAKPGTYLLFAIPARKDAMLSAANFIG